MGLETLGLRMEGSLAIISLNRLKALNMIGGRVPSALDADYHDPADMIERAAGLRWR